MGIKVIKVNKKASRYQRGSRRPLHKQSSRSLPLSLALLASDAQRS